MQLSQTDIAYFAGIMDGEGSISLKKVNTEYKPKYRPCMTVGSTDPLLVRWILDRFGGSPSVLKAKSPKHKHFFKIDWQSKDDVKTILHLLIPYLIIKKRQAELVLSAVDLLPGLGRKLNDEDRELLEEAAAGIASLNQRGPSLELN